MSRKKSKTEIQDFGNVYEPTNSYISNDMKDMLMDMAISNVQSTAPQYENMINSASDNMYTTNNFIQVEQQILDVLESVSNGGVDQSTAIQTIQSLFPKLFSMLSYLMQDPMNVSIVTNGLSALGNEMNSMSIPENIKTIVDQNVNLIVNQTKLYDSSSGLKRSAPPVQEIKQPIELPKYFDNIQPLKFENQASRFKKAFFDGKDEARLPNDFYRKMLEILNDGLSIKELEKVPEMINMVDHLLEERDDYEPDEYENLITLEALLEAIKQSGDGLIECNDKAQVEDVYRGFRDPTVKSALSKLFTHLKKSLPVFNEYNTPKKDSPDDESPDKPRRGLFRRVYDQAVNDKPFISPDRRGIIRRIVDHAVYDDVPFMTPERNREQHDLSYESPSITQSQRKSKGEEEYISALDFLYEHALQKRELPSREEIADNDRLYESLSKILKIDKMTTLAMLFDQPLNGDEKEDAMNIMEGINDIDDVRVRKFYLNIYKHWIKRGILKDEVVKAIPTNEVHTVAVDPEEERKREEEERKRKEIDQIVKYSISGKNANGKTFIPTDAECDILVTLRNSDIMKKLPEKDADKLLHKIENAEFILNEKKKRERLATTTGSTIKTVVHITNYPISDNISNATKWDNVTVIEGKECQNASQKCITEEMIKKEKDTINVMSSTGDRVNINNMIGKTEKYKQINKRGYTIIETFTSLQNLLSQLEILKNELMRKTTKKEKDAIHSEIQSKEVEIQKKVVYATDVLNTVLQTTNVVFIPPFKNTNVWKDSIDRVYGKMFTDELTSGITGHGISLKKGKGVSLKKHGKYTIHPKIAQFLLSAIKK